MPLQGLRNSISGLNALTAFSKRSGYGDWKRAMTRNVIESQVPMPRRRPSQYWQALCQAVRLGAPKPAAPLPVQPVS
jgi:hypothetical protein